MHTINVFSTLKRFAPVAVLCTMAALPAMAVPIYGTSTPAGASASAQSQGQSQKALKAQRKAEAKARKACAKAMKRARKAGNMSFSCTSSGSGSAGGVPTTPGTTTGGSSGATGGSSGTTGGSSGAAGGTPPHDPQHTQEVVDPIETTVTEIIEIPVVPEPEIVLPTQPARPVDVPEPGSLALLGLGLVGLGAIRRRR